ALRAVVDGEPGTRPQAGGRSDVDERAAAAALEDRQRVHRREIDAFDVDRVHAIEFSLAHFEVRLVAVGPAGVVDHDRQVFAGLGYEPCPIGALGDVALHEARADLPGYAGAASIDVVDDHLGA